LGVATQMVGRVGGDSYGKELLQGLAASGVGCDRVWMDSDSHSGVAVITVDDASENNIVIIPGANGRMDQSDVERLREILPQTRVLLLQLEIPLSMVIAAAQAAKAVGVTVVLDPAPARSDLPLALYPLIDIVTPNQIEASQLTGLAVTDWDSAAQAADVLRQRGVSTVIIKLGQQGAYCLSGTEAFRVPSFPVTAVDSVAAGDAFNGGLAAALAEGLPLRQATAQASAVAALSVTKAGAQPSLPTQQELRAFLS
jgi:ribokinase